MQQDKNRSAGLLGARRRLLGCCAVLALALSALVFAPVASAETSTYLALGDSISFGYTQEKFTVNYPNEAPSFFEEGFTNFLQKKYHKTITLVNDGCPGETSNGLIGEKEALGGKTSTENNKRVGDYHPCSYHNQSGLPLHNSLAGISQLEDALSILKEGAPAHAVPLITLNIGSNDELAQISQCEEEVTNEYIAEGKSKYGSSPEGAVQGCIIASAHALFTHIATNIGDILGVIDSTATGGGHYTGRIVVLGFYNPQALVLPGSDKLQTALNETIEKEVIPHFPNARFANPFPVFNKGKTAEKEQVSICKYTEMCNPNVQKPGGKPAGKDGDIHPSIAGYKAMEKLVNAAYTGP